MNGLGAAVGMIFPAVWHQPFFVVLFHLLNWYNDDVITEFAPEQMGKDDFSALSEQVNEFKKEIKNNFAERQAL